MLYIVLIFISRQRFPKSVSITTIKRKKLDMYSITFGYSSFQLIHDFTSMESFWTRYNKVLLDKLVLEKERAVLSHENEQLRVVLKQYLDGISVNDEILSNPNPLFVVNNKTNVQYVLTLLSWVNVNKLYLYQGKKVSDIYIFLRAAIFDILIILI